MKFLKSLTNKLCLVIIYFIINSPSLAKNNNEDNIIFFEEIFSNNRPETTKELKNKISDNQEQKSISNTKVDTKNIKSEDNNFDFKKSAWIGSLAQ